jgi:transcriptional repressor NrdR
MVMEELRDLDEVAYVRFASVYRSFQDVTEFQDEIRRLREMTDEERRRNQMSLLPDESK